MAFLLWLAFAFFCGSLPFSVWLGKIALGKDIRHFGDANPGAANVFRAGSQGWGWIAILLDILKGALPVGLANFGAGITGWPLAAIALAPVAGHAFSPFLRFKGGKAIAVSLGIWCGLTLYQVPLVLGLLLGTGEAVIKVRVSTHPATRLLAIQFSQDLVAAPDIGRPDAGGPALPDWPGGHGASLGLAVARRVMDLHGGQLEISAGPRGGCTVTLTLPAGD